MPGGAELDPGGLDVGHGVVPALGGGPQVVQRPLVLDAGQLGGLPVVAIGLSYKF